MFGGVDLERKLKQKDEESRTQSEREKRRRDVDGRGFSFSANKAAFDTHLYGDDISESTLSTGKELIGFKNFADSTTAKKDDEEEEGADSWRKAVADRYGAPQKFLAETAEIIDKMSEDPFAHAAPSRPSDREDSYKSRWRKRQLSPDRVDPFAKKKLTEDEKQKKRSYNEVYLETKLELDKNNLMYDIQKKEREKQRNEELEKRYGKREPVPEKDTKRPRYDDRDDRRDDRRYDDRERRRYDDRDDRRDSRRDDRGDRRRRDDDDSKQKWGNAEQERKDEEERKRKENIVKEEPNFKTSGKLAEQENKIATTGVVLKWTEPPEARAPPSKPGWRLYVMKDGNPAPDQKDPIKLRRSCFLFGRDRPTVDIPTDHNSCSKQHAALVFRSVQANKNEELLAYDQVAERVIKPYLIDLQSTNGTKLNGKKIDDSRYYELRQFDVIQFGNSTREYMLMTEEANEDALRNLK
jgi:smad nuclear-interacting protein 1